jgi:hypothetical protein
MNSIMERWVRTCRRELLDRSLILNQRHLLHALREYEVFYNAHRPHQGIANARPLVPLPEPITDPDRLADLNIHRRDRRRQPPRIPARSLTNPDGILGRYKVEFGGGVVEGCGDALLLGAGQIMQMPRQRR